MHMDGHVPGFEGCREFWGSSAEEVLGKVGYISITYTDVLNQVLKTRFSEILI